MAKFKKYNFWVAIDSRASDESKMPYLSEIWHITSELDSWNDSEVFVRFLANIMKSSWSRENLWNRIDTPNPHASKKVCCLKIGWQIPKLWSAKVEIQSIFSTRPDFDKNDKGLHHVFCQKWQNFKNSTFECQLIVVLQTSRKYHISLKSAILHPS